MKDRSVLNRVTISGYKSLGTDRQPVDLEFGKLNIIIGANGVGKSNLFSFFEMLSNIMTGALQIYVAKKGTAESLLQFGSKHTKMISANLEFQNNRYRDVYEFSLVKAVNDTLIFSEERIVSGREHYDLCSGQKESYLLTPQANHKSEKIVRTILSTCKAYQFHDTSAESRMRNNASVDNNRYLMSDGGNIASFLYMLRCTYPRYYQRIVSTIKYIMPSFDDFYLEPMLLNPQYIKLQWRTKGDREYLFGPEHFSDGTLRFIALATLLLQPPELMPVMIFIDEPELGLHPQAIDVLASMIKQATEHTQIILATQSARLLDSFQCEDIIVAEKDVVTGCTSFKRLQEEELKVWLEDYSISQLWEKNIIGGQP